MIISSFKFLGIGSFGKDAAGGNCRLSESALREIVFLKVVCGRLDPQKGPGKVQLPF